MHLVKARLVRKYKGNLRSVVKKGMADFAMSVLIQAGKSLRKKQGIQPRPWEEEKNWLFSRVGEQPVKKERKVCRWVWVHGKREMEFREQKLKTLREKKKLEFFWIHVKLINGMVSYGNQKFISWKRWSTMESVSCLILHKGFCSDLMENAIPLVFVTA